MTPQTSPSSYYHVEGRTDVGCKRSENQDWLGWFECKNGLVATVCDGMGGHAGGQTASHVAVEAIKGILTDNYFANPSEAIVAACNAANIAVHKRAQEEPALTGMGTTCVMLIMRDGKVYCGCIGDSRIYLVRDGKIRQLTKDQSLVQQLVDCGEITPEQAERHPRKNVILNAIGIDEMQPATVLPDAILPQAGDCFVLCSDGLSGMVSNATIEQVVNERRTLKLGERAEKLIRLAREAGGLDNITSLLVEFTATPPGNNIASESKPEKPKKKTWIPIVAGACLLTLLIAVAGFFLWKHFQKDEPEFVETHTLDGKGKALEEYIDTGAEPIEGGTMVYEKGLQLMELEYSEKWNKTLVYVTLKDGVDTLSLDAVKPSQISIEPKGNIDKEEIEENHFVYHFNKTPIDTTRYHEIVLRYTVDGAVKVKYYPIFFKEPFRIIKEAGKSAPTPKTDTKQAGTTESSTKPDPKPSDVKEKPTEDKKAASTKPPKTFSEVTQPVSSNSNKFSVEGKGGSSDATHIRRDYTIEMDKLPQDNWYTITPKGENGCEIEVKAEQLSVNHNKVINVPVKDKDGNPGELKINVRLND